MVVSIVSVYRMTPGRSDEFRSVAAAHRDYVDSLGGQSHWRLNVFASDAAGEVLLFNYFADEDERAATVDRLLADRANNPMDKALDAANPPGVLLRRSALAGIGATGSAPVPTPPAVLIARAFRTSAANRQDAIAAIDASRERGTAFGLRVLNFESILAGANYGQLVRGVFASSFADVVDLTRKSLGASVPDPIEVAKEAGILTEVSRASSVLYEV